MEKDSKNKETFIEIPKHFPRPPRPAVMMFQPVSFEIIPNERVTEWEEMLLKYAGFSEEQLAQRKIDNLDRFLMYTESGCPSSSGRTVGDDCDEL